MGTDFGAALTASGSPLEACYLIPHFSNGSHTLAGRIDGARPSSKGSSSKDSGTLCLAPLSLSIREGICMRAVEIIAALVLGLILFVALKLIGLVIQVAVWGAIAGLVLGFVLARMLRRA
jgi:membrane associated rhomboid family serine protease